MDYKPRILSGMHIQVDTRWISDEFVSGEFMTLEFHWNVIGMQKKGIFIV